MTGSTTKTNTYKNHVEAKLAHLISSVLSGSKRVRISNRRIIVIFGLAIAAVWALAGAFVVLVPKTYTSMATLVLPAANSNSSVSLNDIGQTSTSAGSPFALRAMNPNVVYKTIAQSDRVRGLVARRLNVEFGDLKKPRVKLIEETSMMEVHVSGPSSQAANIRTQAFLDVINEQLDELRNDEVARRAQAIENSLTPVRNNLRQSRLALTEFHEQHGLVSLDQFNALTSGLEQLRRRLSTSTAEYDGVVAEHRRIASVLGLSTEMAAQALRLQSNPQFVALQKEHGEATAVYASLSSQWGQNHPQALMARARFTASRDAISGLIERLRGPKDEYSADDMFLGQSTDRSELYRKFVELDARAQGLNVAIRSMQDSTKELQSTIGRQSIRASQLEDLQRDHKIAEAVFSSALARLDTGRQDIYASYPLVQLMSAPSIPNGPSSPRLLYVVAGAGIASLFIFFAGIIAWSRMTFTRAT